MKPISIIVLDDHALILEAINSLVKSDDELVFLAGFQKASDLFGFFESNPLPDILLLDIQLEDEDGLKIASEISKKYPAICILMLSSLTQAAIVMDALKKGAKGYLPKNISLEDLKEASEMVMKGKTYLHKDISFVVKENTSSKYEYLPKLTRREKEILQLILEEMTTSEIAEKLHISVSTVETHRASLFSKTGSKNVVGLIKFTLEKGLLS